MSILICLLIVFILQYTSTNSHQYGMISDASINTPGSDRDRSTVQNCTECLCDVFQKSKNAVLVTCTPLASQFICEFYDDMPTRDQIDYPRYGANIYIFKNEPFKNGPFKDNCCNTKFLVRMIEKAEHKSHFEDNSLRSIIKVDSTIITLISDSSSVLEFNDSLYSNIKNGSFSNAKSIGYYDNRYYIGTDNSVEVYDETLTSSITSFTTSKTVTSIRFLNGIYMLVAADTDGVLTYKKDANGSFTVRTPHPAISNNLQVHAIGVINESAFYVGWDADVDELRLFTQNETQWELSESGTITHKNRTRDVVVDGCGRVWVVEAGGHLIFIYDQNETNPYNITIRNKAGIFNLLILEDHNYTLITTHESIPKSEPGGITRIQPDVNCRLPRKKNN